MKDINELSVIINGLDDGASTGEIRRLFHYKAHGISDFLKAILSLSPNKKCDASAYEYTPWGCVPYESDDERPGEFSATIPLVV